MKTTMRIMWAIMTMFVLSACGGGGGSATPVTEGGDQTVLIDSNPRGAECDLTRESELISHVSKTPGSVHIEKTSSDIIVKCQKDGMTGNALLPSVILRHPLFSRDMSITVQLEGASE